MSPLPSTPPPSPSAAGYYYCMFPKCFFLSFENVFVSCCTETYTHTTRKHILNERKSIEILKVAIEKVLQQKRKLPHTPHRHNHHHTTNETIKHTIRIERESERTKGASKSEKRKNQINFQNKNVFIRFGNYSAFYLSFHLNLRNHVESTASD